MIWGSVGPDVLVPSGGMFMAENTIMAPFNWSRSCFPDAWDPSCCWIKRQKRGSLIGAECLCYPTIECNGVRSWGFWMRSQESSRMMEFSVLRRRRRIRALPFSVSVVLSLPCKGAVRGQPSLSQEEDSHWNPTRLTPWSRSVGSVRNDHNCEKWPAV